MKAYVIITGLVFAMITVAHVARMILESAALARDPVYLVLTLFAAGLAGWAAWVLRGVHRK